VELRPIDIREAGEIERAVTAFARASNGGLIVTAGSGSAIYGDLIITLAARHKLPAVYGDRHSVSGGGLISYGPDRSTNTGKRPPISIASSRVRSPAICQCRRQPDTNW
jgi:hypothetical protein